MSEEVYHKIGEELSKNYGTSMGQMFGKACLKSNGKAFAVLFHEDMVFKLGKDNVDQLKSKLANSKNWDPSGKNRAMKDWLQVPSEFNNDWKELAEQALDYINSLK